MKAQKRKNQTRTRGFRTGLFLLGLMIGVCWMTEGAWAISISVTPSTPTVGEAVTLTATGCSGCFNYLWSGAVGGSGSQISHTFHAAGTYTVMVQATQEVCEYYPYYYCWYESPSTTKQMTVKANTFTVNIVPTTGCTVIAGDGGVDDDEPDGNGIVCSSETTDDTLCTEQYANSQIAALKIVPDPGHSFRGWTVNGAEIELASSDPLLLTTLPALASLAAILPPGTSEANVGTSGCPEPLIAATFRIPVHGNQPEQRVELEEVTENDSTFFRTFGGVRLHLTIPEEFRTHGITYEWIAPAPKFVITNASIAALFSSISDATLKTVKDTFLGEEFSSETELHDALYETIISFRITEEGIQHIIQEEEAKGAGKDQCLLDICTVIQDYMELQPDFVQAEKRTEDELFQLVTAMINDARWNSGKLAGKYSVEFRSQLAACAYEGDDIRGTYLQRIRDEVDQRETLIALIVEQASREAMFFSSAFGEEPASGAALTLPDIYWQPEARPDLDEVVQIKLTYPLPDDSTTSVTVERRLRSREFAASMEGDDVTMFQHLVNFFAWQNVAPLVVDGQFGGKSDAAVKRTLVANYDETFWNKHIYDLTRTLVTHYKDYRTALNGFAWNNGEPTEDNGTISEDHDNFPAWLQTAVNGITTDLPDELLPTDMTQSDAKYQLLEALSAQEIRGQTHWTNWVVTISSAGALGFLQTMPLNSERYNTHPGANPAIKISCNLYTPDGNLSAGAQILDGYMSDAFSDEWTVSGDTQGDLLAKALAGYNGVGRNTLKGSTWNTLFTTIFSDETRYHVVHIKQDLIDQGWSLTIQDFEKPYKNKEVQQ